MRWDRGRALPAPCGAKLYESAAPRTAITVGTWRAPTRPMDSSPTMARPELASGTLLGGLYEIVGRLGSGGFANVYRAEHLRLHHHVAVKLLDASRVRGDLRERFGREALFGAHVRSPNLVDVVDAGTLDDGAPYLVMELLNGPDLGKLLARTRLGPDALVDLGVQLSTGLAALHAHDIVHRDVKPGNVVVQRDSAGFVTAKLVDLGVSSPSGEASELSRGGTVFGTVRYMPPECLQSHTVDGRSDIYSLGVTLYEAACGESPFEGATVSEQVHSVLTRRPPPLADKAPDLPARLCDVIDQALAFSPEDRPVSAVELRERLEDVRSELSLSRGREAWRPYLDDIVRASHPAGSASRAGTPALAGTDPFSTTVVSGRAARWLGALALAALTCIAVLASASLLMQPADHAAEQRKGMTLAPVE